MERKNVILVVGWISAVPRLASLAQWLPTSSSDPNHVHRMTDVGSRMVFLETVVTKVLILSFRSFHVTIHMFSISQDFI
jgi:hypothetical protein